MKRLSMPALAAALALASTEASALTFFDLATGDEALFPDARSVAMGRTRLAEPAGAFTGAANPANLAWVGDPRIALGGGLQKLKESRSIPAFDSFDGFLVESVYVLNDKVQRVGGAGAAASAPADWNVGALGVGISFARERDFDYDYSEEVRDPNSFTQPRDKLLALNEFRSDGAIYALTAGAGWAPHEMVGVGASVQFLSGKREVLNQIRFIQDGTRVAVVDNVNELSGERGIFGVVARPSHRLEAAVTYKTETTLDGTFLLQEIAEGVAVTTAPDSTGELSMRYPQEVGVGLAYHPQAKVQTTVRLDAVWTEWSRFVHGLGAVERQDIWDLRFGIEHVFYNGYPVRFGFHYRPSPRDDEVATTTFTFGGGIDVGPLQADLGLEIANRDYRQQDQYDDAIFGGITRTELDRVDESALTAYGTVSWALEGFGR